MSRRRFENLDQDRQQKLLDAAAEEFGARGYEAASLNRILEGAGMSKSSLYYYFDDKADLFASMVERSIAFLFKAVGGLDLQALTAETYWSELEGLFRRAIAVMNGDAWYLRLGRMFYRLRGQSRAGGPTDRAFDVAARWIAAIIERGQALGVVRTDLPMSLLVACAMGLGEALDHWVIDHWDELDDAARLRMAAEQTDLFRRFLAP
ncbi:MAG: TetR family transcriptional regulator [Phenylobacterium sp.]|uniref:TetR/AcrR family transcriptional regulator n=1 Tax=Phenylobacterium sp. TaxID=1871053 RepID=UPI0025CFDAB2|nr:TetR/AcrR family transcriptional regulator [Phenylobacterium sp.]MBI1199530.1 TetR family transcriptional regulator [Phenylobacterium sp.]